MFTAIIRRFTLPLAMLLCLLSVNAFAMPAGNGQLASKLMDAFPQGIPTDLIVHAAAYLFWSLATISLVWSMTTILLRRADFGELFLELVRFIVFTGLFYWLLENVSTADGFIYKIFNSFTQMGGLSGANGGLSDSANSLINIGLNIFYRVLDQTQNADTNDTLILAGMSLVILAALTLVAAQMVLVVIMAWMLAYGGIFLLGFGGARWTSLIAINYYKHAVAVGLALLALVMLMYYGFSFLQTIAGPLTDGRPVNYIELADMFVVALIMAVLGIKLPGLLYTLVTGSPLGLLAGTASMAGTAIITGGGGAIAAATNAVTQHTSSRRENHYATAMDAFRNVSPDLQRGDTMYQAMNVGAYGVGEAYLQQKAKQDGQIFGGPPPVSAWNSGAGGQAVTQPQQASAQAATSTLQESKADAGRAPTNADSWQEVVQEARGAFTQGRGSTGSFRNAEFGAATDQAGSQQALEMQSIGHATSAAMSSMKQMPVGGLQSTVLQPSANSTTDSAPQLGRAGSIISAGAAQISSDEAQSSTFQQSASSPTSNTQQIGQTISKVQHDAAQTPTGGFQPDALSKTNTRREGTHTPTQSNTSLPPISASLTQDAEETVTRRIKQKIVDQREASIAPGMIRSDHRPDGQAAVTDANDEVAAFRDRRSLPDDGAKEDA